MAKVKSYQALIDGWSEWVFPIMKGYRLICCDCGLSHDMEFKVFKVVSTNDDGTWEAVELDPAEYRVEFRARRNNRSTAQVRRHDKKKCQ